MGLANPDHVATHDAGVLRGAATTRSVVVLLRGQRLQAHSRHARVAGREAVPFGALADADDRADGRRSRPQARLDRVLPIAARTPESRPCARTPASVAACPSSSGRSHRRHPAGSGCATRDRSAPAPVTPAQGRHRFDRRPCGSAGEGRVRDDDGTLAEEQPLVAESPTVPPPPRRRGLLIPKWFAMLVVLLLVGGLGFAIGWFATPDDSGTAQQRGEPGDRAGSRHAHQAPTTTATAHLDRPVCRRAPQPRSAPRRPRSFGHVGLDPARQQRERRAHARISATRPIPASRSARPASRSPASTTRATSHSAPSPSCTRTRRRPSKRSPNSKRPPRNARARRCRVPSASPTTTTKFNSAPDGSWADVDGVDRLAFDFVTTDSEGGEPRTRSRCTSAVGER